MVSSSARAALPRSQARPPACQSTCGRTSGPLQRDGQPARLGVVLLEAGQVAQVQPQRGPVQPGEELGAPRAARGRPGPATRPRRPAAPPRRPAGPSTARLKLFSVRPSSSGSPMPRASSTARRGGLHPAVVGPERQLDAERAEQPGGHPASSAEAPSRSAIRSSSSATMSSSTTPCGRQFHSVTLPQTAAASARHGAVAQLPGHGDRLGDHLARLHAAGRCAAGRCPAR